MSQVPTAASSSADQQPAPAVSPQQVRDALAHLYDPGHLQTHPLSALVVGGSERIGRGRALQRALLESLEALRPVRDGAPTPQAVRRYRLLSRRYVDGLAWEAVRGELLVSRSEYYREHQRALEAVASLLGERLGAQSSGTPRSVPARAVESAEPTGALPVYLTSFVGREAEGAEVAGLLAEVRLLTLTGAGGCGKTRLAVEVAAGLAEADSTAVWFVDLAPLADPTLVPQTVTAALGLREAPGRVPAAAVAAHLRGRAALLVLDNCEHVVEACARLAEALLQACPGLRVLATSREPLGVPGESLWRVRPLATPPAGAPADPDSLAAFAAVRLFVERARASRASFALSAATAPAVAEICRWLDGIPLALELAAARVRGLAVEQIAARLSDRFQLLTGGSRTAIPRQQTLRALVDWSHELLSGREQALLRRLAVFSGGCGLEAAEVVGAASAAEERDVLEPLLQLVDKSLVVADEQAGAERYRLLETIRQYALEKLLASGEAAAARSRHGEFYLALAERAADELTGRDQAAWYRRLEAEHGNLRGALEWSRAETDAEKELRLAAALGRFWRVRGHNSEGRAWLSEALARASTAPSAARAAALNWAGHLEYLHGDVERAAPLAEEAVAAARAVGDPRLLAIALRHLAWVVEEHGDEARRAALVEEALAVARTAGDEPEVAFILNMMGRVAWRDGDLERGRALLDEAVALSRRLWDRAALILALHVRGSLALTADDLEGARAAFEEARGEAQALGYGERAATALAHLGDVARRGGDRDTARTQYKQALSELRALDHGDLWGSVLLRLAGLSVESGELPRAARLYAAVAPWAAAVRLGLFNSPPTHGRDLEDLRAQLGEPAVAAAWASGERMTLAEAVDWALAED